MDDTLAIISGETVAKRHIEDFKRISENIGLRLKPEKIQIIPLGQDFVFCKERFVFSHGQYYRLYNPQRIRNIKRRIKADKYLVEKGQISEVEAKNIEKGMICSIQHEPYSDKIVAL